ncbi:MAG: hypothetical protein K2G88_06960 [Oscillospiraceae bacterium]|nr:hypothetical protein [Oscillospiraceae bacterium]
MNFEKQIKMIEKGKQIGYCVIKDEVYFECGIQKKKDLLYLVYFSEYNLKYEFDENGKQEFYSYSNLEDAIAYIISRKFPFDEFKPQKGNKIFDMDHPKFPNIN